MAPSLGAMGESISHVWDGHSQDPGPEQGSQSEPQSLSPSGHQPHLYPGVNMCLCRAVPFFKTLLQGPFFEINPSQFLPAEHLALTLVYPRLSFLVTFLSIFKQLAGRN